MEWFVEVCVMALVLVALVTILVICHPSDEEREGLREQKSAYKDETTRSTAAQRDPDLTNRRAVLRGPRQVA